MSPQQPLQLEGASLEELLERVRREHGPSAQIVKAEKVRKGGVGGFFARETFVIEVVLDVAPAGAAAVPAAVPGPRSVLDLVDQRNAEESGISTQTDAFSTMLARLQREQLEPEDDFVMVRPKKVVRDIPAPRTEEQPEPFIPQRPEVIVEDAPEPVVVVDEAPAPRPSRRAEDLYVAAVDQTPETASVVEVAPKPRTSRRATDGPPAAAQPSSAKTKKPVKAVAVRGSRTVAPVSGLPARVITSDGTIDPALLMQWLRALPEAPQPPLDAGSVIALVGPVEETYATATRLAADLGIDPGATSVVSRTAALPGATTLRNRSAVAGRRDDWVGQDDPAIVVVDAPLGARRGAEWRNQMLDEVAPTFTYGVLPASTKPEDLEGWAERLGGVDALALYGVTETSQPATALQSGIPVGLLDGAEATPAVWAGLLLDRMVAA
jgi:hypothetical protein